MLKNKKRNLTAFVLFVVITLVGAVSVFGDGLFERTAGFKTLGGFRHDVLSSDSNISAVVLPDGSLWTWGSNQRGLVGDGTNIDRHNPIMIMEDAVSVSVSQWRAFAIKSDGSLWGWGHNSGGMILGDGTGINRNRPVWIMDDVVYVSAGHNHTMAIKSDGSLWGWGANFWGTVGDGTQIDRRTPVHIMDDVVYVSAGHNHTMAIKSDGSLWGWGNNAIWQIGDGTPTHRHSPVRVMDDVAFVTAGEDFTLAIKTDSSLWAWGENRNHQLGDGTSSHRQRPVRIMDDVVFVTTGLFNTMVIKTDGSLWAWGDNHFGLFGDGSIGGNPRNSTKIMDDVIAVSVGRSSHALAIRSNGSLWGWGNNGSGQLGIGVNNSVPAFRPLIIMGEGTFLPPTNTVTGISINQDDFNMLVGEVIYLTATITPYNATNTNIIWSSSDNNIATINAQGVVTAISSGVVTITATTEEGGLTDFITITVVDSALPQGFIKSFAIGSGDTQITGFANDNQELVFNITEQEFELLQDSLNWVRGDIVSIEAYHNLLTFTNPHGSWELGIGEEAGFWSGHTVHIQGFDRVYTIVINIY